MEASTAANPLEGVLLLDSYTQKAARLVYSFRMSGFVGDVVVIHDDGFLPDNVLSVPRFFSKIGYGNLHTQGYTRDELRGSKPRYFNEIEIPDFWEISAQWKQGLVQDMGRDKGLIYLDQSSDTRIVRAVDWFDEHRTVRMRDNYDNAGHIYARTYMDKSGQPSGTVWFDENRKPVLNENHITGSFLVEEQGSTRIYPSLTDLTVEVLNRLNAQNRFVFFNSLSTPFFASDRLGNSAMPEKKNVLFWQEENDNGIPGNMQMIFNGNSARTQLVMTQSSTSYSKLVGFGTPADRLGKLGFIYPFVRENQGRKNVLICTNSDQIEGLEQVLQALPQWTFHIAALTNMSSKLESVGVKFSNAKLYPQAKAEMFSQLFEQCDYYLDINHGNEIVSAGWTAFLSKQLIVALKQTVHQSECVSDECNVDTVDELIAILKDIEQDEARLPYYLTLQNEHALSEDAQTYKEFFEMLTYKDQ